MYMLAAAAESTFESEVRPPKTYFPGVTGDYVRISGEVINWSTSVPGTTLHIELRKNGEQGGAFGSTISSWSIAVSNDFFVKFDTGLLSASILVTDTFQVCVTETAGGGSSTGGFVEMTAILSIYGGVDVPAVMGATGAKGDKGDKGNTGQPGRDGEDGEMGPTGERGAKGDKGDKGDTGPAGRDGEDGEPGPQGPPGSSAGGGITQLTGDVTAGPGSGSVVATNVKAPDGFKHLGKTVSTLISAPASPAAGFLNVWADSSFENLFCKNSSGVVNHGVQTRTFSSNLFLAAIGPDGQVTTAQPDFSGITGQAVTSQITNNAVTLGKMANLSNGLRLLGSTLSSTAVQEISLGGALQMSGTTLNVVSPEVTLQWGGYEYAVGSLFPLWLGLGSNDYQTSSFGYYITNDSSLQDFSVSIVQNFLVGSGTIGFDFYKNNTNQGQIALFNYNQVGGYLLQNQTYSVNAGDLVGIRMASVTGSISSGDIRVYVVARFRW